jgi:hypothetical protein
MSRNSYDILCTLGEVLTIATTALNGMSLFWQARFLERCLPVLEWAAPDLQVTFYLTMHIADEDLANPIGGKSHRVLVNFDEPLVGDDGFGDLVLWESMKVSQCNAFGRDIPWCLDCDLGLKDSC